MADRDRELHRKGTENVTEGSIEELKGKVRGKAGDLTDDRSQQAKGKVEELKGKVQKKVGEAQQDAARNEP